MTPPAFYLALGARFGERDLIVARLAGQQCFLVPIGTPAARTLREVPGIDVVVDSGAWPPQNPHRPSLRAYWHELRQAWQRPDGTWRCTWFAAYDTIGSPTATAQAYRALQVWIDHEAPLAPLVPVTHFGAPAAGAAEIILDLQLGWAGQRADLVEGVADRPVYGIGGLVPERYSTRATSWYGRLIEELELQCAEQGLDAWIDDELLQLHLFGVGRPSWTLASPLVRSFDSSGPLQMAKYGWAKIAKSYNESYGLSPEKLQRSREARLAYHIIDYRAKVGLPWELVDEAALYDDDDYRRRPLLRNQLALPLAA